jgi:hypothetical protein
MECRECQRTEEEVRLTKCAVCHRGFCDEHAYTMSGRTFCSRGCAEYFFFSTDED